MRSRAPPAGTPVALRSGEEAIMKRTRKLTLSTQTLRRLDDADLATAAGGSFDSRFRSFCAASGCVVCDSRWSAYGC
jgi:hypothetical protein